MFCNFGKGLLAALLFFGGTDIYGGGCKDIKVVDSLTVSQDPFLEKSVKRFTKGGKFNDEGYRAQGGSIAYTFDSMADGYFSVEVYGVSLKGVGKHDLFEFFTGKQSSISDNRIDRFAIAKLVGKDFPNFSGTIKLEMGKERDEHEAGSFSPKFSWQTNQWYQLEMIWAGGIARFRVNGSELTSTDYNKLGGSPKYGFETLRLPNDGIYQNEPEMNQAIYRNLVLTGKKLSAVSRWSVSDDLFTVGDTLKINWDIAGNKPKKMKVHITDLGTGKKVRTKVKKSEIEDRLVKLGLDQPGKFEVQLETRANGCKVLTDAIKITVE